ncbi:MAG: phage antirepressor KilAC domain-containing protein [Cellvibrionaceae bacterium]
MSMTKDSPVIAGIEITTDAEGRFSLNTLHKAHLSISPDIHRNSKQPGDWLKLEGTKELIGVISNSEDLQFSAVESKSGRYGGTFAHELLAISYAGWISPSFQLKVNQTFLDYKAGRLKAVKQEPAQDLATMLISAGEELRKKDAVIKVLEPKAEFHDKVAVAEDAVSVAEAAKVIGTGQKRLFAFLRKKAWVTRLNEPYQSKIEAGLLDVKVRNWNHPDQGLQSSITALVTGKGLVQLQKLYSEGNSIPQF